MTKSQTQVVALIDYDNVRTRQERNEGDVGINLAEVLPLVAAAVNRIGASEVDVRFYGGWITEQGRHSRRAEWLLRGLAWYRGRRGSLIVKPTLVTALACRPSDTLLGTVRSLAEGVRQKMVDCLLAVDMLYLTRDCGLPVVLFTDDEDLVPAALAARGLCMESRIHWLRRRSVGSGMNDSLLARSGINLARAEEVRDV